MTIALGLWFAFGVGVADYHGGFITKRATALATVATALVAGGAVMDDFNGDFRYLHDEIEERAQDSIDNQENLPELMCQIFAQCEKTIERNKQNFLNEIDEVINKQQASFSKDNEQKVPQFSWA